ncbi:MAG TPA: 4Fe-4S single cluster domain-containing protein [Anaerolineales bacterium]|nr:4Fe-4S single cluster domain-containing protein [Anaerolineales bacterium]
MNTLFDHEHSDDAHVLNIAAMAAHTQALGPGTRAVVWVQGCPLNCPGCLAPKWIPFVPAMILRPEEILEELDLDRITGLTFSGGEPMEQAAGLAALARLARRKKNLDLICFSGYRYERLLKNPPNNGVAGLLAEIDVLIDGPFIQSLNDSVGLRGSSNQRAIHLTTRLREYDFESNTRKVEITINDGELAFIGIPTPGIMSAMQTATLADKKG